MVNLRPWRGVWALVLLAVVTHAAGDAPAIPWLGDNLAPNPGFEELVANGEPAAWRLHAGKDATATTDEAVRLQGKRSLRLATPTADADVAVESPPIPIEGGATYLVSVAFRQEGFNTAGKADFHEGVSSAPYLYWLDADGRTIGRGDILSRFPYGPSRWDLRDAFERAPANARFAMIRLWLGNGSQRHGGRFIPSTLWLDAVQLRRYQPPPTPEWALGTVERHVEGGPSTARVRAYFVGAESPFHNLGGSWSQLVPDPAAERGMALQARLNEAPGIMGHSPYFAPVPAGLYRVRARVRVPGNGDTPAGYLDVPTRFSGMRLKLDFRPTGDAWAVVEGDFILRDAGWWALRLYTAGKVAWRVDSLKVFPLAVLQDRQLVAIYPGSEGQIPDDLRPPPFEPVVGGPPRPMKGLAVLGFGYDRYRIADVFRLLHRDAQITPVWVTLGGHHAVTFNGFPENPADFFQYSIIYLCNVNVRALALPQKHAIHEFVRRGGALVVMGGHQGYERGGWQGSLIEQAMPVEVAPDIAGGLIHDEDGLPLRVVSNAPCVAHASLADKPLAWYLHRVTLKPGATVLMTAGDHPFLVTGSYGEGRVVCFLGVPWGTPKRNQTPFWAWDDWVDTCREVCWWALKCPEDPAP